MENKQDHHASEVTYKNKNSGNEASQIGSTWTPGVLSLGAV